MPDFLPEKFKHETLIDVRFADIDSMQHVNNAKYLTYIETARINYLSDIIELTVEHADLSVILASAKLDFILPIKLGDQVKIMTRCSRLGTKSFDLEYYLLRANEEDVVTTAKAITTLVGFDYKKNLTIAIPDIWKNKLKDFEGEI